MQWPLRTYIWELRQSQWRPQTPIVLLIHAPQLSKAHFSSFPVSAQTSPLGDATTTTLFFFPIAVVDLAGDTAATAPPPPSLPRIVAG
uniref:Uncharacterized protein n=1 Tax=Oryza nivara TaxID=4536 RepID=A0A0E0I6K2_ORYNI